MIEKKDCAPLTKEFIEGLTHHEGRTGIQELTAEIVSDDEDKKDDEYTAAIKAAHPARTGDHDTYAIAMRMVGNRHSKAALVELVNWLLHARPHAIHGQLHPKK